MTKETDFLDLADRFFTAIERGDLDAVADCYAPDAVIWINTDGCCRGRAQNLKVLKWLSEHLHDRRYIVQRRVVLEDGFLQQHELTGRLSSGASFSMPACVICRVADGRIVRLDEYLDSAGAALLSA